MKSENAFEKLFLKPANKMPFPGLAKGGENHSENSRISNSLSPHESVGRVGLVFRRLGGSGAGLGLQGRRHGVESADQLLV